MRSPGGSGGPEKWIAGVVRRTPVRPRACAWLASLHPVKDHTGRTCALSVAAMDSTEQLRARRRLSLLIAAGSRIGTTLDLTRTAEELTELGTVHVADFVIVDLLDSVLGGADAHPAGDDGLPRSGDSPRGSAHLPGKLNRPVTRRPPPAHCTSLPMTPGFSSAPRTIPMASVYGGPHSGRHGSGPRRAAHPT